MPKISQLPVGTTPGGSETIPAVQNGQTVQLTVEQIIGTSNVLQADTTLYVRADLGTCTFTNGSSSVAKANHGLSVNDPVVFKTSGSLPTNFSQGTIYYVKTVVNTGVITVSATVGGSAVTAGSAGSGTHRIATGNDANDGLAANRAHALLTRQAAADMALLYDRRDHTIVIQHATSYYADDMLFSGSAPGVGILNGAAIYCIGDQVTPGNCEINAPSSGFWFFGGGFSAGVLGFKISSGSDGIHASQGAFVTQGNNIFGTVVDYCCDSDNGAQFQHTANFSVVGNCKAVLDTDYGGNHIVVGPITVTFTGTPTFSQGLYNQNSGTIAEVGTISFSGTFVGPQFTLRPQAQLSTSRTGSYPGTLPPIIYSGGMYLDGNTAPVDTTLYKFAETALTGSQTLNLFTVTLPIFGGASVELNVDGLVQGLAGGGVSARWVLASDGSTVTATEIYNTRKPTTVGFHTLAISIAGTVATFTVNANSPAGGWFSNSFMRAVGSYAMIAARA